MDMAAAAQYQVISDCIGTMAIICVVSVTLIYFLRDVSVKWGSHRLADLNELIAGRIIAPPGFITSSVTVFVQFQDFLLVTYHY